MSERSIAKVESEGARPHGTRILLDDGTELTGVQSVEWVCNAHDHVPRVVITVLGNDIAVEVTP